jgi:flagellar biosynthesis protein FlhF
MNAQTQTFRAPDMMAALEEIQRQLGPDALVLSVREVFDESIWKVWKKPGVEVLAADGQPEPALDQIISPSEPARDQKLSRPEPERESEKQVVQQPGEAQVLPNGLPAGAHFGTPLDKMAESWEAAVESRPAAAAALPLEELQASLIAEGVARPLVDQLVTTARRVLPPQVLEDRKRVKHFLQELLEAEIEVMPEVQFGRCGVICVVGPGGAGKTSLIAKLAAGYTLEQDVSPAWITADTIRGGAVAEAQAYTDSLEIPFVRVYSPEEFGAAVEDLRDEYLVLADLFDCNPRRKDQVEQVRLYLEEVSLRETYLALAATSKLSDVQQMLEAFEPLGLNGLIPTKLDQTGTFGNLFSAGWGSRLPLPYLSNSPRAADPLEIPDPKKLSRLVLAEVD